MGEITRKGREKAVLKLCPFWFPWSLCWIETGNTLVKESLAGPALGGLPIHRWSQRETNAYLCTSHTRLQVKTSLCSSPHKHPHLPVRIWGYKGHVYMCTHVHTHILRSNTHSRHEWLLFRARGLGCVIVEWQATLAPASLYWKSASAWTDLFQGHLGPENNVFSSLNDRSC